MSSTGISGSDSTSVLKAFSVSQAKKANTTAGENAPQQTETSSYSKTDAATSDKPTKGKVPANNVAFHEQKTEEDPKPDTRLFAVALDGATQKPLLDSEGNKVLVLLNAGKEVVHDKNGEETLFNSDGQPLNAVPAKNEKGEFLKDADGQQILVKIDSEGNAKYDKDKSPILLNHDGYPIDLSAKPTADNSANTQAAQKTAASQNDDSKIPSNIVPALLPSGEPLLGKDGKKLRVLINETTGQPVLDKTGQPQLFDWEGKKLPPPEKAHTLDRINWLSNKMFASQIITGVPKFIVKQVAKSQVKAALSVALKTSEIIGTETVAKASGEVTAKTIAQVSKVSGKALGTVMETVAKAGTEDGVKATVKALTESGKLGQGIATVTMKEGRAMVSKEATSFLGKVAEKVNPVTYGKAVSESVKAVDNVFLKEVSENGILSAMKKVGVGAAEKTMQKGLEEGAQVAVQAAIKEAIKESAPKLSAKAVERIAGEATTISLQQGTKAASKYIAEVAGKEAAEKIASTTFQKTIAEAVSKGTAAAAEKGTAKVASKISAAAPYVGAAIGVAITAWDAHHAYKLTVDPKVTKLSAGLAWATVGLDAVSTVTTATGVGAPIGWVATGLSIGTSIASDIYKYKK